mmetsp:Transcript_88439/g.274955  ORF Transcript_88439/g.274955 Transcript_88439/m.274955 type:complete len:237 (+) Transcript_88439:447-1157(+)
MKRARAAVVQLQLAHCTFISPTTWFTRAWLSCTRNSSGLCQSSMASPLTSTSLSTMAPMKVRLRVSRETCSRVSASCNPVLPRVLSQVRTFHSSRTSPPGQMGRSHFPSSDCERMRTGGPITTMTWPKSPPAVPNSTRPPLPRTKSTSPGATAPSSPASPQGSLCSRRNGLRRRSTTCAGCRMPGSLLERWQWPPSSLMLPLCGSCCSGLRGGGPGATTTGAGQGLAMQTFWYGHG